MSESVLSRGVTRRTFLKATAAAAAVAAVGDKLFGGPVSTLVESAAAAPQSVTEDVWIPSACWNCRYACGILAHRVDGVVVGVKGNPACSLSQGRLCVRGQAVIHKLYNPYRVRTPMKRTNPEKAAYNPETDRWEGVDPGWVEISWDEALDTVAAKMREVKEKDPRRFLHLRGWGIRIRGSSDREIARAFGTPNSDVSGGGGLVCAAARHTIAYIFNGTSGMGSADKKYSRYAIMWGRSTGVNKGGVPDIREFWNDMYARGNKYVVIDPRCSEEASKAYLWVKIKPGTDGAMGRAFCNVLLNELGIYDEEFMKLRSNGPYLIGPDGFYVRSQTEVYEDASRKETLGKPLIWDPTDETAKPFDDPTFQDFALEGSYVVDGVQCQPAFQLMVDHYKPFTPEWAAEICGVEPALIRRIAKEYAEAASIGSTIEIDGHVMPFRPVSVECGRGWQSSRHGMVDCLVYAHLNAIVGAVDVPGALLGASSRSLKPEGDGVVKPGGSARYTFKWPPDYQQNHSYWPISYKAYTNTWAAILDPEKYHIDYPIEVMCMTGANPTQTMGGSDQVVQAFAKIPFSFAFAYHFDQQPELADILFPDAGYPGWLHRHGDNLRQPLLEESQYNTRLPEEVLLDLAERVGILPELLERWAPTEGDHAVDLEEKYTWQEVLDRHLRDRYGGEYGLEWFKQHGVAPPADPGSPAEEYGYYHYPMGETRYPIYFEYLLWAAEKLKSDLDAQGVEHVHPDGYSDYMALPDWKPGPLLEAPAEYDLMATNWKSNTHTMGFTQDNPYLMEISALHDPYLAAVWMNKATAEARGLKQGDLVWVESYNTGKRQRGPVYLSEAVHDDSVMFGMTANNWSRHMNPDSQAGMIYNLLVSTDHKYIDPISGGIEVHSVVKVYKA
jgi:anaerobic selenocysteine-containing dehydrogenase